MVFGCSLPAAGLDALPEFAVVKRLCLAGFDLTLAPFRLASSSASDHFFGHLAGSELSKAIRPAERAPLRSMRGPVS